LSAPAEVVGLLGLLWASLAVAALWPAPIALFGRELRRPELFESLRPQPTTVPHVRAEPPLLRAAPRPALASAEGGAEREVDRDPQRILIIGDSMLDGLLPPLGDYAAENGHSVNAVIWYGSRTIDWARGTRLTAMLEAYQPTYVIVALGSSELFVRNVEKRAPAVRRVLQTIAPRRLVWIGPPNWKQDTGINALLEQEVGEGRYFRSAELDFERKRDRIHPTMESSRVWFQIVARWIVRDSVVPILLDPPSKTGTPRPPARVFPPPK
jgi:lysophospholipase L1-like esterase